ncbi:N-hydroxyarylamine O-acetyltransferase [Candidatus Nitrosoglobus terrae]|uniref:N-hydroxyarylamine O-acetyltransferase n=1 Tax=Candidatus Nitrosoglobus terrae TaxID=1630141 RepID=A0A1Q2SPN8_9GAMM|nr:arylamine N-acetyltransferase [Candidatus Nitrosoglobus terrae]BAW81059.1 N-hydroxyarylamine O-acetyltransferase [Candidatus Nitrosoglobus terrae]
MQINLSQYLTRIGYQGSLAPTVAVLHGLTRAHSQSIPFENLDVFLRRPVELELDALFNKLVLSQRGGYCFEQNGLFLQVLLQLGFKAKPLAARVRLRTVDRSEMPPRTHLFIIVTLAAQQWLTDVGVGSLSLTQALLWQNGLEQQTPHDRRRLIQEEGRWFHQVWQDNHWQDIYEFWGEVMPISDQKVANWYTSTHPESSFRDQIIVSRALPEGGRLSVLGDELRHRHPNGGLTTHRIQPNELKNVLLEHFNLRWPEE